MSAGERAAVLTALRPLTDLTTLIGDVLEPQDARGSVVSLGGLTARTTARRICGFAAPLRLRPAAAGERLHHDPVHVPAQPGRVAVLDAAGVTTRAVLGGRLARLGRAAGIEAFVVHGAVRDVEDLDALSLPVWSTSTHPAGALHEVTPDLGATSVDLGGLEIRPDDLLALDGNGLALVRADAMAEVVPLILERARSEAAAVAGSPVDTSHP